MYYLYHLTEITFSSLLFSFLRMQAGAACTKPAHSIRQAVFVYISAYPSKAFLTFHPTNGAVLSWMAARKKLGELAGRLWEAWCNTRLRSGAEAFYKDREVQHLPLFSATYEYKWSPQIAIRPYCINLGFPRHTAFLALVPYYFSAGKPISILFISGC